MKLKPIVYFLGLFSPVLWADPALDYYRQADFKKAAHDFATKTPNDAWGQYYLAEMNLYGYGVLKNNTEALALYQAAAQKGFLPAILVMARYELILNKNPENALVWFKKAADMEDLSSLMYVAAAYKFGLGVIKNEDTARKYYIAAAKLGNPLAQETLAEHFLENKHAKNNTLGWLWLNKAMAQNDVSAWVLKAKILYRDGEKQEAETLIQQAMKQNFWPAYYQKGLWAMDEKNWQEANTQLLRAAKHGFAPAQIALSELYSIADQPFYHPQNAYLWMLYAAQHQDLTAQKKLALMYKNGQGVEQNDELAKQWQQLSFQTQKNSPETMTLAARWLSSEKTNRFSETEYRLKGIWSDWHNPVALKTNRMNAYPKFIDLGVQELFKPEFVMVMAKDVPLSAYWDAILKVKGPLSAFKGEFPHYADDLKTTFNAKAIKQIEHQANLGVVSSQFLLAQCYQNGLGFEQNLDLAREWLVKAAKQDHLGAQYELALLDLKSDDVNIRKQGLENLRAAAFKGNDFAEYAYALLSEHGVSSGDKSILAEDLAEAKNMLMLASVNHNGLAKYRLAELMARESIDDLSMQARVERDKLLRRLYRGAVKAGIHEAELPLAFYDANSQDAKRQTWAYQTAQVYAEKGNPEAALLLGLMMSKNKETLSSAKSWFERAKEHPIGAFVWASYMKDPQEQKIYLTKAAQAGFSYAYLNLAVLKQKHAESPLEDLNHAVELQNHQASFLLANLLLKSSEAKSIEQGRDIFKRLADLGDAQGQWKLGYLQVMGLGGAKEIEEGFANLSKAAQSQAMAQYVLAYLYHMGYEQNKPDELQAKKWFRMAATSIPEAWLALGYILETYDLNYMAAQQAYEYAVQGKNLAAQYNLGLVYEYGKGRSADYSKAQQYFLAASEQGSKESMLRLAGVYLYSKDSHKHAKEALRWYQKAAELGDAEAYYRLGLMYEGGVATRLSYEDALKNYQKAAELGDERAKLALLRIQGKEVVSQPVGQALKTQQNKPFAKMSVDLQYLYILDAFNQGKKQQALTYLQKMVQAHPDYVPAKFLWQKTHT